MSLPTPEVVQSTWQQFVDRVNAEIQAFIARNPGELQPSEQQLAAIVASVLGAFNWDAFKSQVQQELVALALKGSGPAPHDPTELA